MWSAPPALPGVTRNGIVTAVVRALDSVAVTVALAPSVTGLGCTPSVAAAASARSVTVTAMSFSAVLSSPSVIRSVTSYVLSWSASAGISKSLAARVRLPVGPSVKSAASGPDLLQTTAPTGLPAYRAFPAAQAVFSATDAVALGASMRSGLGNWSTMVIVMRFATRLPSSSTAAKFNRYSLFRSASRGFSKSGGESSDRTPSWTENRPISGPDAVNDAFPPTGPGPTRQAPPGQTTPPPTPGAIRTSWPSTSLRLDTLNIARDLDSATSVTVTATDAVAPLPFWSAARTVAS